MSIGWLRFTIILGILVAQPVAGLELSHWREFSSDHFVVYSDRSVEEAETLLYQFEQFRQGATLMSGTLDDVEGERTQIYLFKNAEHYQLIQPDSGIAGFYKDTLQGARMVVGAQAKLADLGLVLFHEYTHHLTRFHKRVQYPLWYEEGFADLLGAAELSDGHITFGLSNGWREGVVNRDDLLPLDELLSAPAGEKSRAYWDRYYASAWIFVHYLQLDFVGRDPRNAQKLNAFLEALYEGVSPKQAVFETFVMGVSDLDRRVRRYAQQRYWKGYRVKTRAYEGKLEHRSLTQNEIVYLLGDLAYRAGQPESALSILQHGDGSHPSFAPALSLRAVLEAHKGQRPLAQHYLGLALGMDDQNTFVLTNAAHLYWDWSFTAKSDQERSELLNLVSRHSEQALRHDLSNWEAARYLALSLQKAGQIGQAVAVMKAIHQHKPTDVRLNFELGRLLMRYGRPYSARRYLRNVVAWDHSHSRRLAAKRLLVELERQQNRTVTLSELDRARSELGRTSQ